MELSRAGVIGDGHSSFGIVGRGAARVLSEPIAPRVIDGRSYLAVDMGIEARKFPFERRGVSALYNRNLNRDPRSIVGFTRNISLVTEEQVRALEPPAAITDFPAGLFASGLLFSGVYEDGWMAEAAKFRLGAKGPANSLQVRAEVPGFGRLSSGVTIEILIDGRSVDSRRIGPGKIDLRVPVEPAAGARWIELRIDTTDRLPGGDGRIGSMRLERVALEGRGE